MLMDINILKSRFVALASNTPVKDWSVDDANIMTELAKDPDFDMLACIADTPQQPVQNLQTAR